MKKLLLALALVSAGNLMADEAPVAEVPAVEQVEEAPVVPAEEAPAAE